MHVLITGSEGQLGSELVRRFEGHELMAARRGILDVTDFQKVREAMVRFQPDLVIHAAANTDVDGCEEDPDSAYMVNAVGTQNVALACLEVGAVLVYVSTDFVFDGKKSAPYHEYDQVNPLSVYGRSKLAGELIVGNMLQRFYIVRTAWVFGKQGNNFVKTVLRVADEKGELRVVDDQVGSPTYAADLAAKIEELAASGQFGLYHVVNQGSCSWYEFTREILRQSGRENVRLERISSAELARPAPRPAYSVLDAMSLRLRGFSPMRPFEAGLRDFLASEDS